MSFELNLTKHHGAGNDFLVLLDLDSSVGLSDDEVVGLCNRHTGVGADGVLRVMTGTFGSDLAMELRNADGTRAEMSGNGIRCFVQAAVQAGIVAEGRVVVATDAGIRDVYYQPGSEPATGWATVSMGAPSFGEDLEKAALSSLWASLDESDRNVLSSALGVSPHTGAGSGEQASSDNGVARSALAAGVRVDMGNPHLVLILAAELDEQGSPRNIVPAAPGSNPPGPDFVAAARRLLSLAVEQLVSLEPQGANVELAWQLPDSSMRMIVWERGAGETLACGTGSCAVAAAAVQKGLAKTGSTIRVTNPGGVLEVAYPGGGEIGALGLAGPAKMIASISVDRRTLHSGEAGSKGHAGPGQ